MSVRLQTLSRCIYFTCQCRITAKGVTTVIPSALMFNSSESIAVWMNLLQWMQKRYILQLLRLWAPSFCFVKNYWLLETYFLILHCITINLSESKTDNKAGVNLRNTSGLWLTKIPSGSCNLLHECPKPFFLYLISYNTL